MKFAFKILSLMLIPAVVLAVTTGAWMNAEYAFVRSIPLGDSMPPCHAHAASVPVQPVRSSAPHGPANYQCCLTDHAVAVVHDSECSRPAVQFARVAPQIEPTTAILLVSAHELRTIVLSDPPGATPLRI